ncbi:MAG: GGDEF domain-containing protein [bacterium JZ-2024 1]
MKADMGAGKNRSDVAEPLTGDHLLGRLVRSAIPYMKELYPAWTDEEVHAETFRLANALVRSLEEGRQDYFLTQLRSFFYKSISQGVYLERIEAVAREFAVRKLPRDFIQQALMNLPTDLQSVYFRIIQEYASAFQEFSARQLKEFEILSYVSSFQTTDLRKMFLKVFRETLKALQAPYGVFQYDHHGIKLSFKRLGKGARKPVRDALRRITREDSQFDPNILEQFSAYIRRGGWKGEILDGSFPEPAEGCTICQNRPLLRERAIAYSDCRWLSGLSISSFVCVPMEVDGEVRGRFLIARRDRLFTAHEFQFLRILVSDILRVLKNYYLYQELRTMANVDALTGLLNRRALMEVLQREHNRATRYARPYALVMADIDHFKEINDRYGHGAGDTVLKAFAKVLSENMRSTDFVGRYGGEEFLMILPESSVDAAYRLAERARGLVERTRVSMPDHQVIGVTASFGVCGFPDHGRTLEGLLRRVDDFLYRAKQAGRNRVEVG